MQRLEVSGAVRPLKWTLGVKWLRSNVTPILHKIQEYKRNWLQHINRMHRNELLTVLKKTTDRQAEGTR
jgi:hypothetical protein